VHPKINIVGINHQEDAKRLLAKLTRSRHEAAKDRKELETVEKSALIDAMVCKEASFIARGMDRA
jgi:hypothetical protein